MYSNDVPNSNCVSEYFFVFCFVHLLLFLGMRIIVNILNILNVIITKITIDQLHLKTLNCK